MTVSARVLHLPHDAESADGQHEEMRQMETEEPIEIQCLPSEIQTEKACIICGRWARTRWAKYCWDCLTGRKPSSVESAVAAAIRRGGLRPAKDFACVDCGAPARHYDHRDYNKPLEVEPVCVSCNLRRPPAVGYGRAARVSANDALVASPRLVLAAPKTPDGKFDRTAYQRDYMPKWRAARKANKHG